MAVSSFKELRPHVGHRIEVVNYGIGSDDWSVAIECLTCHEVLVSFDNDEDDK